MACLSVIDGSLFPFWITPLKAFELSSSQEFNNVLITVVINRNVTSPATYSAANQKMRRGRSFIRPILP